eukprot:CAMPEP_0170429352 /NCGR_PEP_ID=MMETSP0117_2-20130122/40263_1 /TAXON_ID=400756 /ORGANISM="Durinskia baltica, Strain CSIRO CS-38" /LENGTH=48 /DNA_ID= /DNA_START= /DNA_END= /DNA_ORIENTATION=
MSPSSSTAPAIWRTGELNMPDSECHSEVPSSEEAPGVAVAGPMGSEAG